MKFWNSVLVAWALLGLLPGCSANRDRIVLLPDSEGQAGISSAGSTKRDLIVLLPDPDGKVGAIRVTTEGGSEILDKPRFATQVEDISKPPMAPQPIDEREITSVFGAALSMQPSLTGRFTSFILWFENNKTELTYESKKLLTEIMRTIKNRKTKEIYVAGHTDRVGTELHNLKLSSRRAYYIRDFLIFGGIESSSLVVSFHGEAIPLIYTEDEVPEPLNRRVEVMVR